MFFPDSNSNVDGPESDEESVVDVSVQRPVAVDSSAVKKKTYVSLSVFALAQKGIQHLHFLLAIRIL